MPNNTSAQAPEHRTATDTLFAFLDNPAPSVAEVREVFAPLTVGEYTDVQIAALLATMRTRGTTAADITGAAQAFLVAARDFPVQGEGIMDCVGTGGDGANTINISTGASLLAAACGLKVVKHGNRSVSSRSGSADVLEALGIPLDLDPGRAERQVLASGFTFLFAPAYHPAFAHVMPVRKQLKVPTIFNVLGPVLNPARPARQLLGLADPTLGPLMINTLKDLGRERALVVHGAGTDECAVHGPTQVWELVDGEVSTYTLSPADFGVGTHKLQDLEGGDGRQNAAILREIFANRGTAAQRDAIVANAGALFYLAGRCESFAQGSQLAAAAIEDGTVTAWLREHEEANYAK